MTAELRWDFSWIRHACCRRSQRLLPQSAMQEALWSCDGEVPTCGRSRRFNAAETSRTVKSGGAGSSTQYKSLTYLNEPDNSPVRGYIIYQKQPFICHQYICTLYFGNILHTPSYFFYLMLIWQTSTTSKQITHSFVGQYWTRASVLTSCCPREQSCSAPLDELSLFLSSPQIPDRFCLRQ